MSGQPHSQSSYPPSFTTSDAPPSYTESLSSYTSYPPSSNPSGTTLQPPSLQQVLNPLATHLHSLPSRIRASTQISHSLQSETDLLLLSYILPHVERFLVSADIAAARAGVAALVLIPEVAVAGDWGLSEVDERRKMGEIIRVGRVMIDVPGKEEWGDEKRMEEKNVKGKGEEFDGWGRWDDLSNDAGKETTFWWQDEAMARRLAGYLQPKEAVKTDRKDIKAEVKEQRKEKGLFGWGKKAAEKKHEEGNTGDKEPVGPVVREVEGVSMTVRAEEVSFRRENEFGVWESQRGWSVVVTIRVRRT